MTDKDDKIVAEYTALLERSHSLFQGLRDLPQYGQKQWYPFFQKAFDCYTKLWKFQQQHRHLLETKCGLKRYEIGEIASRIAQLYYHYYLRTSDTSHLLDSFMFYQAVRERGYFAKIADEGRPELMVKKLRHYARGAVVCLFLRRDDALSAWATDFGAALEDYAQMYKKLHGGAPPPDLAEWVAVLKELESFLEAENRVTVPDAPRLSFRVRDNETPAPEASDGSSTPALQLQEVLIAVQRPAQVKFSELYIDMFRLLQVFERDPPRAVLKKEVTKGSTDSMGLGHAPNTSASSSTATLTSKDTGGEAGAGKDGTRPATTSLANTGIAAVAARIPNLDVSVRVSAFSEMSQPASTLVEQKAPGTGSAGRAQQRSASSGSQAAASLPKSDKPQSATSSASDGRLAHSRAPSTGVPAAAPGQSEQTAENNGAPANTAAAGGATAQKSRAARSKNPHKYLLYRPTIGQLTIFSDMAMKELTTAGAMLLYLSGEGASSVKTGPGMYERGGVMVRADSEYTAPVPLENDHDVHMADIDCVYPGDLLHLTRRPMVLVVDSSSSAAFEGMVSPFGQPLLCLLSPTSTPAAIKYDPARSGSLFTLFLYSPIKAVASIAGLADIPHATYAKCEELLSQFYLAVDQRFKAQKFGSNSAVWRAFLSDDFLRLLIYRFVFCCTVLRLCKHSGQKPGCQPTCSPPLPGHILPHPSLQYWMLELANELQVRGQFATKA